MHINKKLLHSIDFDSIPINQTWNFEDEKENLMHRIHAYPAKFPAFITQKAMQYIEKESNHIRVVGDVFCGCGTTAYEAVSNGKEFWGCDINPVATLIARVKSSVYNLKKLDAYFNEICEGYSTYTIVDQECQRVNERIKYWFEAQQIKDLLKLKSTILSSTPQKSKYRDFFLCAFSNILKRTSKWLQKSIKPTIDPNKKLVNVMDVFIMQYKMMKNACETNQSYKITPNIKTLNFLELDVSKLDIKIDLLVTSPPYVTSYEYADLHQLSTLWLDFSDDFKSFRKGSIGSLYYSDDDKIDFANVDALGLNNSGRRNVQQLVELDKKKAKDVAKYFLDMQTVIKKTHKLLSKDGYAFFVVGNTEYKGVHVDNAKHLVESMYDQGFSEVIVDRRKISNKILTPYRTQSGQFTTDKNSRQIYAEEFVIMGKK